MQSPNVFGIVGKDLFRLRLLEIWLREACMVEYANPNRATLPRGEGRESKNERAQ